MENFFVTGNKSFAHTLNWNFYLKQCNISVFKALENTHNQTEEAIDATPASSLKVSCPEHIQIMAKDAIANLSNMFFNAYDDRYSMVNRQASK